MLLQRRPIPKGHERHERNALCLSRLPHAERVVETAVALVGQMEPRLLLRAGCDASERALGVREQLHRLLVGNEIEHRRLLVLRPLRNAPDAARHLLDLDACALRELADEPRVERNLDAVLGPISSARLRVADRDPDATGLPRLDDHEVGDPRRVERADLPLDPGLGQDTSLSSSRRQLADRFLHPVLGQVDDASRLAPPAPR